MGVVPRNTNHNYESKDDPSIELGPREFEAMGAPLEMSEPVTHALSFVAEAETTDPMACPEPITAPWEWPTSGEPESDVVAVEPIDDFQVRNPTSNATDTIGGAEQSLKPDTIPAPPPIPEDAESFDVP